MPKTSWEHINSLLHKAKSKLTLAHSIEKQSKKLRVEMGEIIEEINDIILEQQGNNN